MVFFDPQTILTKETTIDADDADSSHVYNDNAANHTIVVHVVVVVRNAATQDTRRRSEHKPVSCNAVENANDADGADGANTTPNVRSTSGCESGVR